MAGISIDTITKVFPNGVRALDGLSLDVEDGEFFALLGPSGCGKTTLLRTIAGLEQATGGTIGIGGRDVTRTPPGLRDVAMVFQDYALFPHMTVADNISYPLKIKKVAKAERLAKAVETGGSLSLAHLMERRPAQLSGGQQQRVALARAIAARPQVFLFDEPLSNLDARLRLEARTFLKKLQHELGVTTVFVTHDQAEALALADRIAVMDAGQLQQVGTPREVFRRPATTFVANFIGSNPMNLLDGVVTDGAVEVAGVPMPVPVPPLDEVPDEAEPVEVTSDVKVTVGIRPEYMTLSDRPTGGGLPGRVSIVENLGSSSLVTLEFGGDEPGADTASALDALVPGESLGDELVTVQVTVPEDDEPEVGAAVWATALPDRILLYRAGDGTLISDANDH